MVAVHGPLYQGSPAFPVPVFFSGPQTGLAHILRAVTRKHKTVFAFDNGIPQSPGFPDNGNGAVTQGQHLGQSAGLRFAGHQKHIAARVNVPGQFRQKAKTYRAANRNLPFC